MSWTEERVGVLTKLWLEGLSASQIAGELGEGVTRNAVIGKVHRLKLSGRAKPANSSQRARTATRMPRRPKSAGGAGFKRRAASARVVGATVLKPLEVEENGVRLNPDNVMELFIPVEERIGLLELTEKTCKWPVGDPLLEDFYFCGRNSDDSAPYCEFHAKRAYHTMDRKKR